MGVRPGDQIDGASAVGRIQPSARRLNPNQPRSTEPTERVKLTSSKANFRGISDRYAAQQVSHGVVMRRMAKSGERARTIETHFPAAAAIARDARMGAFAVGGFKKPRLPAGFDFGRDAVAFAPLVTLPVVGTIVPKLGAGARSKSNLVSRLSRSSDLESPSIQLPWTRDPSRQLSQDCWHGCSSINEPGIGGIVSFGFVIVDTTCHTILSRITS